MSESLAIDFLYRTAVGRFFLKGLVNPRVSEYAAKFLSSRASARIIPFFIKRNKININEFVIPEGGYKSFNDFFTRRIKPENRVIAEGELISPCDGYLTVSNIDESSIFHIKNTSYSLKNLLGNECLANEFTGGTALIFRLTPSHYHRYVFCTSGIVERTKRIQGILHSVKPICHEKFPVFIQNSREYTVLNNVNLGDLVQMEVGALLVEKISNDHYSRGEEIFAGQEKGFFEYGGSSIVVLTKFRLDKKKLKRGRLKLHGGIPVKMGEVLIRNI